MNSKKLISIIAIFTVLISGTFFAIFFNSKKSDSEKPSTSNPKPLVVASFYPLYFFTSEIGKDLITVKNTTPNGVEPHDYEPTSQQIQDIYNSKLFVFNGAGLDPWAEKIEKDVESRKVKTINISQNFNILKPLESPNPESQEEVEEFDPHIWLDPEMAKKQVEIIQNKLIEIDPNNKSKFEQNAKNLKIKLDTLDSDYKTKLAVCSKNQIITSHNFLQYVAKKYNFISTPISGISPDSEPSSQNLAFLSKLVKEKNLKYIFTETLSSPKLAQTIATETGAKTLGLNPIEGLTEEEVKAGKDYFSIQKENLDNLAIALECR